MIESRVWRFLAFATDPTVGIDMIRDLLIVKLIGLLIWRRADR
jgi:hypothetical protein